MRLAIVSPYPPAMTGIGQYGYHISHLLAQSGVFDGLTILTGAAGTAQVPMERLETGRPQPDHAGTSAPIQIKTAWQPGQWNLGWKIHAELQALKPDLVWYNLGVSVFGRSPLANLSGFLSLAWARRLNLPTVVTLHELAELADLRTLNAPGGPLALHGARLLTHCALQADVVCLTMRRYTDWLAARQPDLHCLHIPLGAYHLPERLPESNAPELLFFTTLAPFKGLEVLLEAFRLLLPAHPGLRLTIAGSEHARFPGYARRLREQFQGLDGLRWLGQVPEEQVRALFQRAQIVVLPYLASTGSSSVLSQAAMWGRSVVTSDLAETRAVISESGLEVTYFERGQARCLAQALKMQLETPALRRQQVERNFWAIQRHGPEETCRAYLQAFDLALATHRSPKRNAKPAQATPGPL
jgi:glycosyltransferase involved in cell wall biosynthesis